MFPKNWSIVWLGSVLVGLWTVPSAGQQTTPVGRASHATDQNSPAANPQGWRPTTTSMSRLRASTVAVLPSDAEPIRSDPPAQHQPSLVFLTQKQAAARKSSPESPNNGFSFTDRTSRPARIRQQSDSVLVISRSGPTHQGESHSYASSRALVFHGESADPPSNARRRDDLTPLVLTNVPSTSPSAADLESALAGTSTASDLPTVRFVETGESPESATGVDSSVPGTQQENHDRSLASTPTGDNRPTVLFAPTGTVKDPSPYVVKQAPAESAPVPTTDQHPPLPVVTTVPEQSTETLETETEPADRHLADTTPRPQDRTESTTPSTVPQGRPVVEAPAVQDRPAETATDLVEGPDLVEATPVLDESATALPVTVTEPSAPSLPKKAESSLPVARMPSEPAKQAPGRVTLSVVTPEPEPVVVEPKTTPQRRPIAVSPVGIFAQQLELSANDEAASDESSDSWWLEETPDAAKDVPATPSVPSETTGDSGCDVNDSGSLCPQAQQATHIDAASGTVEDSTDEMFALIVADGLFDLEIEVPLNVAFRSMQVAQTTTILPADSGPALYTLVDPGKLRPVPPMRELTAPLGSQLQVRWQPSRATR